MIERIKEQSAFWVEGQVTQLSETCWVVHGAETRRVKWAMDPIDCHFLQREALWLQRLMKMMPSDWASRCFALERIGEAQVLFSSYHEGQSLDELTQLLDVEQRVGLAADIFLALREKLAALHQQNVVHGDIKLANLIWDPLHKLSLIDFANTRRVGEPWQSLGFSQTSQGYAAHSQSEFADVEQDLYAARQCLEKWCFSAESKEPPLVAQDLIQRLQALFDPTVSIRKQ